jgi:hypothetical protein
MRPFFGIVVALLSISGCTVNEQGIAGSWEQFNVQETELELVDDKNYELLVFGKEGTVSATIGLKDGPLTAPLLYWHIEGNHLYITQTPHSNVWIDLHEPRIDGTRLTAKRGAFGKSLYVVRRRSS